MQAPDPNKPPLSASELAKDAENKDRTALKRGKAAGHSLPASETGTAEQEPKRDRPAMTMLPPD